MMARWLITSALIFTSATFASPARAACPSIDLPERFELREWPTGNVFNIVVGERTVGTITPRLVVQDGYEIRVRKQLVAKSFVNPLSWGVDIRIQDCERAPIGEIKEEVEKSWSRVYSSYEIRDPSGNVVGISEKSDWFATQFVIHDGHGNQAARMDRSQNLLSGIDTWHVRLTPGSKLDPRVVLMIPVYKTNTDNEREGRKAR